jgi:hypothetical protein
MDADRPEMTVEYLQSWEAHGATWRPLVISDTLAVVELCTCYGEAVDRVQSAEPAVIAFVRSHPPP